MMGFAVSDLDAPITKITNCLLAPTARELPPPAPAKPCIRCGHCAEACPASLLPQQLYWYARAKDHEQLSEHRLLDCIECGACAYVCPSQIPLVQYYRAAKGQMRDSEQEKRRSDNSRERFEARQTRLEAEALAKEAKRAARKAAAQEKAAPRGRGSHSGGDRARAGAQNQSKARRRELAARHVAPCLWAAPGIRGDARCPLRYAAGHHHTDLVFWPGDLDQYSVGGAGRLDHRIRGHCIERPKSALAVSDLSIFVTSTLLCIALPPYAPWWLIVLGWSCAVLLGKHVFGGLGYNPFNPAMVGYVVLLISFPRADEQLGNSARARRGPGFARHPTTSFSSRYH